jgi:hypothetical protein
MHLQLFICPLHNRWSWQLSLSLQFGITAKLVENISLMHKSALLDGKRSLQRHPQVMLSLEARSTKLLEVQNNYSV